MKVGYFLSCEEYTPDHPTTAEIRCSHCGELLHAADASVTPLP